MATITATKSGNWSDTTVWNLARAPLDGDTVLAATYTITFDVDVYQPNSILNATSGHFRHSGAGVLNVTANANVGNHSVTGLIQNVSTGTLNFAGAIKGGSGVVNAYGANNAAGGTITITTCTGGSGGVNAYGANNAAGGTITITTCTGGSGGSNAYGANNAAGGTITITTCTGGSGSGALCANNAGAGTITITTCTGGSGSGAYGANNGAAGTITITTCTGGSGINAHGANNAAAGTITITTAVGNDYGPGGTHINFCVGVSGNNTLGQITRVYSVRYGAHGQTPTFGPVQMVSDVSNQAVFMTNYSGGTRTLTAGGNIGPVSIVIGGGGIRIS